MCGQFTAQVSYENQSLALRFMVTGANGPSLWGRDWLHDLCLNWNFPKVRSEDRLCMLLSQSKVGNAERFQGQIIR